MGSVVAGQGPKSPICPSPRTELFDFPAILLPVSLTSQRLLSSKLLARFQVKGVTLDLLNNVLLLDFTLEAAKGVF